MLASSHSPLLSSKVISAWLLGLSGCILQPFWCMSCTKDLCSPQDEHGSSGISHPNKGAQNVWIYKQWLPRNPATPCTHSNSHRVHSVSPWGRHSHVVQRIHSSPLAWSYSWRGKDIHRASCMWIFCLGNLSPRGSDMLRGWGHLAIVHGCPAPCQSSQQTQSLLTRCIFPSGKIPGSQTCIIHAGLSLTYFKMMPSARQLLGTCKSFCIQYWCQNVTVSAPIAGSWQNDICPCQLLSKCRWATVANVYLCTKWHPPSFTWLQGTVAGRKQRWVERKCPLFFPGWACTLLPSGLQARHKV